MADKLGPVAARVRWETSRTALDEPTERTLVANAFQGDHPTDSTVTLALA